MDVTFTQRAPTPERLFESRECWSSGGGSAHVRQPAQMEAEGARLRFCQSKAHHQQLKLISLMMIHDIVYGGLYTVNKT